MFSMIFTPKTPAILQSLILLILFINAIRITVLVGYSLISSYQLSGIRHIEIPTGNSEKTSSTEVLDECFSFHFSTVREAISNFIGIICPLPCVHPFSSLVSSLLVRSRAVQSCDSKLETVQEGPYFAVRKLH
jgi:hypothetical protein